MPLPTFDWYVPAEPPVRGPAGRRDVPEAFVGPAQGTSSWAQQGVGQWIVATRREANVMRPVQRIVHNLDHAFAFSWRAVATVERPQVDKWYVSPPPSPRQLFRELYGHSEPVKPVQRPVGILRSDQGAITNASNVATTGSINVPSGCVIVAFGASYNSTGGGTISDSQSLGWTPLATVPFFSGGGALVIAVSNTFTAAAALTVTFTATNGADNAGVGYILFSGIPSAGAKAIRQIGYQANGAQGNTPTVPLFAGPPLPNNPLAGAVANESNTPGITPPTGWTVGVDIGAPVPIGLDTDYVIGGQTGQTITWGSTSGSAFAAAAVELNTISPDTPIQVDKWYVRPPDSPPWVQRISTHLGGYAADTNALLQKQTVDVDMWYVRPEEPPRAVKHIPDQLGLFVLTGAGVFVVETTQIDKWFQEPADVARPVRHIPDALGLFVIDAVAVGAPESVTADRWFPHAEEPPRPVKRLAEPGANPVFTPETIFLDKWWPHVEDPPRIVKRLAEPGALAGLGVFVVETSQVDKWYVRPEEPPRPLKRIYEPGALGGVGVFVVETTQLDKWWRQASESPRPVKRLAEPEVLGGVGVIVIETTGLDKWWQEPGDVARPPKRFQEPGALGGVGVVVQETPGLDKWYTEATAAPPRAGRVLAGGQETTTSFVVLVGVDAWASPGPAPDRRKASRIDAGAFFAPVVAGPVGTPFDWQNESWAAPRPSERVACQEGQWVFEVEIVPSRVVFRRGWGTGSRTGTRQQQNNAGEG